MRNLGGRSSVFQSVAPHFVAAPRAATLQDVAYSLSLTWLQASAAPVDSGANAAAFSADSSNQTTGGVALKAERSSGAVELTVLTYGSESGAGPYSTAAVQFSEAGVSNRYIGAVVMWRVESGFGSVPSTLAHDDFDLSGDDGTVTNGGTNYDDFPYGHIHHYVEQAWDDFAGPTSSVTIGALTGNTATGCAWIVYALDDCSGSNVTNTFAEGNDDERVLRWNTTYTDELLIGAIGRVPGGPVRFQNPWLNLVDVVAQL